MTELSLLFCIDYIKNVSSLVNLHLKKRLSLILQGIPNCLPKIVSTLLDEHVLRAGNIGSRIIMDVDVVGLMDEADVVTSGTTSTWNREN